MITYRMAEVYCTQGQNLPSLASKRAYNPVLMNPVAMREPYIEKVKELTEFYRKGLTEVGIDYHPIDTRKPYDHALWAYLQQRAHLRK